MRKVHYLTENASTELPSHIIVADSEAWQSPTDIIVKGKPIIHQYLRLWTAIHIDFRSNNRKEFSGSTCESFWQLLDSFMYEKKKLYVIAHNMAYDYAILKMDTYLSSFNICFRTIKEPFIIKARKNKSTIMLLSSTNWFKQKLEELGEIFGFPKLKIDMENLNNLDDEEVLKYCMRDSTILANIMQFWISFIQENDLGCFRPTIAGQAFNAFRHRFMDEKLLVHDSPEIIAMECASYHGGRNEAFRLGKINNVYKLDINSMYPFVMRSFKYPTKPLTKVPSSASIETIKEALAKGHYVLAHVVVDMKKPFLPVKKDKLIFPIGKFEVTIPSPEIEYLLKHEEIGNILEVKQLVVYEQAPIFKNYVDFFYNLKVKYPSGPLREMAKIFLNSLYGKFGQKAVGTIHRVDENTVEYENEISILQLIGQRCLGNYILLGSALYYQDSPDASVLAPESIPIIASTVTSYARVYLWKIMQIAGDGNYFYCDTDSLFVNQTGFDNIRNEGLLHENELGKMKLEGHGVLNIAGCKSYQFNDVIKQKGIKKDAEILPNGDYRQYQFITKTLRYRKNIPDGIVALIPIIKHISNNYDKGIVNDDDTISPLHIASILDAQ